MKKILAILASVAVGISAATSVIACGYKQQSQTPSKPESINIDEITIPTPNENEDLKSWKDRVVDEINKQLKEVDKTEITAEDLEFIDETNGLTNSGKITVKGKEGSIIEGSSSIDFVVTPEIPVNELKISAPNDIESYEQWQERVLVEVNNQLTKGKGEITKEKLIFEDHSDKLMKKSGGFVVIKSNNSNWWKGQKRVDVVNKLTKTLDELIISLPIESQTLDQWIDNTVIFEINNKLGRIKITRADLNIDDKTNNLIQSGDVIFTGKNPEWLKGSKAINIFVKSSKSLSEITVPRVNRGEEWEAWKKRTVDWINDRWLEKGKITIDDLIFEDGTNKLTENGDIVITGAPGSPISGKKTARFVVKELDDIEDNIPWPNRVETYEEWQNRAVVAINKELGVTWITKDDLEFFDNTSELNKDGYIAITGKNWIWGIAEVWYNHGLSKRLDEMIISVPTENQTLDQWIDDTVISEINNQLGRVKIQRNELKVLTDGTNGLTKSGDITFVGNDPKWLIGSKVVSIIVKADKKLGDGINDITIPKPNEGEEFGDWKNRVVDEINKQLSTGKGQITINDLEFIDETNGLTNSGKITVKGTGTVLEGSKTVDYFYIADLSKLTGKLDFLNVGTGIEKEQELLENAVNSLFPNTQADKLPVYGKDYVLKKGEKTLALDSVELRQINSGISIVALENSVNLKGRKDGLEVSGIDLRRFASVHGINAGTFPIWTATYDVRKIEREFLDKVIEKLNLVNKYAAANLVKAASENASTGDYYIKIDKTIMPPLKISIWFLSSMKSRFFIKDKYILIKK